MQTMIPHLIDSHFHLRSMQRKGIDVESILAAMQELSMEGIEIGLDCGDLARKNSHARALPLHKSSVQGSGRGGARLT